MRCIGYIAIRSGIRHDFATYLRRLRGTMIPGTNRRAEEDQNFACCAKPASAGEFFFFRKKGRFKISLRHRAISLIYDPFSLSPVRGRSSNGEQKDLPRGR